MSKHPRLGMRRVSKSISFSNLLEEFRRIEKRDRHLTRRDAPRLVDGKQVRVLIVVISRRLRKREDLVGQPHDMYWVVTALTQKLVERPDVQRHVSDQASFVRWCDHRGHERRESWRKVRAMV